MQVKGANENQIDAGGIQNRVDIFDCRLSLDLDSDHNFMIGVLNIFDMTGRAIAIMWGYSPSPTISERWVTSETNSVRRFLRRVDHRNDDALRSGIKRLLDMIHCAMA